MRRRMQVGCLALSALLLFAPGASLAVRAETPNIAVFAENADAAVTPESVEELIPLLLHAYDRMSNASTEAQAKALAGIKQKDY